MTTVYVVQGEHWSVPGRPMSVHATLAGAQARALELVNVMLADLELPAEAESAEAGLARVKAEIVANDGDADEADVWIEPQEVQADD